MRKNREYKSDVFSMLMESKENALEVYNALNDSEYTNPEDVEIVGFFLSQSRRTADRDHLQGL